MRTLVTSKGRTKRTHRGIGCLGVKAATSTGIQVSPLGANPSRHIILLNPFETSPTWYDILSPEANLLWAPSSCLCEYDLLQPRAKISTSYAETYIPTGSCQSWKDFSHTVLANWQPTLTTVPASAASQMAMAMAILCWTLCYHVSP